MQRKKLLCMIMAAAMTVSSLGSMTPSKAAAVEETAGTVASVQQPFQELDSEELREDMGSGWNLGNTMDGHTGFTPGETVWQHVKTTKKLIKKVHDLGFNTVRIPVTWGTMIDDDNDYAINEAWISRVQDIVDYCMSQDMYAIINIHHDGAEQTGWLRIATSDYDALAAKYRGVWKNIAEYFKDYDEHLIFESMNEVKGKDMTVLQENQVIMKLNQIFVDTVRGTGSNNARRWLMIPGKYNFIDSICNEKNGFELPEDSAENRIILSIHDYSPWEFCGSESTGRDRYTSYDVDRITKCNVKELKQCYDTYTSKGIPVVVGEYGCINKDNPSDRAFYLEAMNRLFQQYKLTGVYWDQGWYDRSQTPDYSFAIIDRKTGDPIEKQVTDALIRGAQGKDVDYTTVIKDTEVKPIESIQVDAEQVSLSVNESRKVDVSVTPADTNDIVLWKTENPDIATVAYGKIHGKGIGTTTITAFSQSGSVEKTIHVTVTPENASIKCENITTDVEEYQLKEGESVRLSASVTPADTTETLYYTSSDEKVATVSGVGKVVALAAGDARITIHTTGGQETDVLVHVTGEEKREDVRLALNVYYNDNSHSYWSNETASDIKTVSGDGQYELTFDCQTDLSAAAQKAGVSSLNNITAIYIKDYDVTEGKAQRSAVTKCDIRYDKIVVDGTELPITNTGFKSALKDSGIFDTNDPINSWDGSAVGGISVSGGVASFKGMNKPQKITVTFTLQNMSFQEITTPEPTKSPVPTKQPEVTETPLTEASDKPGASNSPSGETDNGTSVTPAATPAVGDNIPGTASGAGIQTAKPSTASYKTIRRGNAYYRLCLRGKNSGTARFVGLKNQKVSKVVIPASVKWNKKAYKVTSVKQKACMGNHWIKKLQLGKNVTVIGKKAFYRCTSLKQIIKKGKRLKNKNIGKKAFDQMKK